MRRCGVSMVCAMLALGCKPPVRSQEPAREIVAAETTACTRLRDSAALERTRGRLLRAALLEEQAKAICGSSPPAAAEDAGPASLEEIWSWMAHTDPKLALSPDRFPDREQARRLDQAVLGLVREKHDRLVVESIRTDLNPGRGSSRWAVMAPGALGRVGEWFERYVVPMDPGGVWHELLGPFADRIVLFGAEGAGRRRSCVVFDLLEGRRVAELTLPPPIEALPVRLDDAHFAVPVLDPGARCGDEAGLDTACPAGSESVELWQAWPPRVLARFVAPSPSARIKPSVVITPRLPNQQGGPPRDPPGRRQYGGYVPTRMAPDAPDLSQDGAEQLELRQLEHVGQGILGVDWGSTLVLIDWPTHKLVGSFRHQPHDAGRLALVSPGGRFVA
jgi:hypothetical protein